jgi:hypothetical protein
MEPLQKVSSMWSRKRPIKERIKLIQDQALKASGIHLPHKEAKKIMQDFLEATHYKNDKYQVYMASKREAESMALSEEFKQMGITYLSIKRLDLEPIHDWRDMQEIKNQLCGKDREGIELYPAEDRVVDTANQYHMFVFGKGYRIPLGFAKGAKSETEYSHNGMKSKQREFK